MAFISWTKIFPRKGLQGNHGLLWSDIIMHSASPIHDAHSQVQVFMLQFSVNNTDYSCSGIWMQTTVPTRGIWKTWLSSWHWRDFIIAHCILIADSIANIASDIVVYALFNWWPYISPYWNQYPHYARVFIYISCKVSSSLIYQKLIPYLMWFKMVTAQSNLMQ